MVHVANNNGAALHNGSTCERPVDRCGWLRPQRRRTWSGMAWSGWRATGDSPGGARPALVPVRVVLAPAIDCGEPVPTAVKPLGRLAKTAAAGAGASGREVGGERRPGDVARESGGGGGGGGGSGADYYSGRPRRGAGGVSDRLARAPLIKGAAGNCGAGRCGQMPR
ncbi:translation initiation factor IF-2-like [Schistocerca cancellata]|uniref:translation initiation factor IF-2-like n=1 Tax=Schistocerca cancellata TaxID=274614 RepID=UPI00211879BD|nr:translation initiation factor IF-2-like [Schistocerca cancellata]